MQSLGLFAKDDDQLQNKRHSEIVDSSQDAKNIVDLYDTHIEKTIGSNAKGIGFNRGDTAFA